MHGSEASTEPESDIDSQELEKIADELETLEDENLHELIEERPELAQRLTRVVAAEYSGPIPPPSAMAAYNEIEPTFATRILEMAESAQAHQQEMNAKLIDARLDAIKRDSQKETRGQKIAAGIVVLALLLAFILALADREVVASILAGTTVVSLAVVFALGRLPGKTSDDAEQGQSSSDGD